jgi:hypothetical protein
MAGRAASRFKTKRKFVLIASGSPRRLAAMFPVCIV